MGQKAKNLTKPRIPRSPVLGPPVISTSKENFSYLVSRNPGAMVQVSDTNIKNTLFHFYTQHAYSF